MHLTVLRLYPVSADREPVWKFLEGVAGPTRVQPGCLGCTLALEFEPKALLYLEMWESPADLLRRLRSAEFGKILEAMESSVCAPEFSVYELINQHGLELIKRVRTAEGHKGEASQSHTEQDARRILYDSHHSVERGPP